MGGHFQRGRGKAVTGLVEAVRNEANDKCFEPGKCRKDGCGISLEGMPSSRLIIDFDKPCSPLGKKEKRCDYLLVADDDSKGLVAALELKSGSYKAGEVLEQLRAGARAAENLVPERMKVRFRPVLVFGKAPHKSERDKLKRTGKVSFHGDAQFIRLIKCGGNLAEKL